MTARGLALAARLRRLGVPALLLLPAFLLATHDIDSADIWFHLATGDLVVAEGRLPRTDPFSAGRAPWIVHDWLAAVGLALLHRAGGAPALVLGTALALALALGLPLALARRAGERAWPYAWALVASTFLAYERFFVRPEIVTIVGAALFAQLLTRGHPRGWRGVLALALVQVVWTNAHAAFLLGPGMAFLVLAGRGVDRALGRKPALPRRVAWILPFVLVAATCVTPYGPDLLVRILAAWRDVGSGAVRTGIAEWQPTFAEPIAGDAVLSLFVACLAAVAAALVAGRRAVGGGEILLVGATTLMACLSRRHLVVFAVTALPVAASWWAQSLAAQGDARRGLAGVLRAGAGAAAALAAPLLALGLAADIARGSFYLRFGPPRRLGLGVSSTDHPIGATEFVARHALRGPMFNNVAAGSYLIGRLRGRPPVYVDGRLLDSERFAAYRRQLAASAEFDTAARTEGFRLVVLALQPFPPVTLFRHLVAADGWRLVYVDGEGAVFVATAAADSAGLAAVDLGSPLPPAPSGPGRGRIGRSVRVCDPGEAHVRGRTLLELGYPQAARADLMRALLQCSARWDVGLDLAAALVAVGRASEARLLAERALGHAPAHAGAWVTLGQCHAAAGDTASARACWERALRVRPPDARAAHLLRQLDR